jgi:4'-phosphopantetheinyl transferase
MSSKILWERPDIIPALTKNRIFVWCANLNLTPDKIDQLLQTLSPDEKERANRFIALQHRQYFIAARGILRQILGHYLQQLPQKVTFKYQEHGKPQLDGELTGKLFFNLTHSHGIALYAVCLNKELGVDIEQIARTLPAQQIAQRFFSAAEYKTLAQLPAQEQLAAFFNCWTRKEAFVKAMGAGLSYSLHQFDVNYLPDQPAQINRIDGDEKFAQQWALFALQPVENYVGALAVTKPIEQLTCYQWEF